MSSVEVSTLFGVKGRVAVITGGSSGIGFMIAKVYPFLFHGLFVFALGTFMLKACHIDSHLVEIAGVRDERRKGLYLCSPYRSNCREGCRAQFTGKECRREC